MVFLDIRYGVNRLFFMGLRLCSSTFIGLVGFGCFYVGVLVCRVGMVPDMAHPKNGGI